MFLLLVWLPILHLLQQLLKVLIVLFGRGLRLLEVLFHDIVFLRNLVSRCDNLFLLH